MLTSSTGNYYKILELKQNCAHTEIRRAYKRLALVHHPDKNRGDKKAEERFKTLQNAYETLKDPGTRRKYDARVQPQPPPQPELEEPETETESDELLFDISQPPRKRNRTRKWDPEATQESDGLKPRRRERVPLSPREKDLVKEEGSVERARNILKNWLNGQISRFIGAEVVEKEQLAYIEKNARILQRIREKISDRKEKAWNNSFHSMRGHSEIVDLWNEQLDVRLKMMRVADMMAKDLR